MILAEAPFYDLSNKLTSLIAAFIGKVSPLIDIRYQLLGNFGGFLEDIPCRLGTSEALDAASDVLVTAHSRFCMGHLEPNSEVLRKYSRALKSLRHSLNDPVQAQSSETLGAVMLLMICQVRYPPQVLLQDSLSSFLGIVELHQQRFECLDKTLGRCSTDFEESGTYGSAEPFRGQVITVFTWSSGTLCLDMKSSDELTRLGCRSSDERQSSIHSTGVEGSGRERVG